MSDIHRILEEIRDIEDVKTSLVDELDRCIRVRYQEEAINEGDTWDVTLTHPDAHPDAYNVPAIRTTLGWLTDTICYDGPVDKEAAGCHWDDEHVYPHYRLT